MIKFFAIACAAFCMASEAFASPADDDLFAAIEAGDMVGVRAALDAGADINTRDEHGLRTPLLAAVRKKHLDVARELVDRGADIDASDPVGGSAFLYASMEPGASSLLRYLKDKGAVIRGAIDSMGGALECAAAYNPDMEVIRTLVDMGLCDESAGGAGSSNLIDACYIAAYRSNPNPDVIRWTIGRGADIYATDFEGDFAWGGRWVEENIGRLAWLRENGFYVANGVTFFVAPEQGHGPSDAWKVFGEPKKVFRAVPGDGAVRKIRFVSDQTAVVELQTGGWKNGLFHKKDTIFSGTISAGKVYEFTAPIVKDVEASSYFLLFTSNDDDQGTVEWYLQEDDYTGRHYRDVWRLDYAAG